VSEALETSLEELHVAYEELQQQYAAVTMSQQAAATAHRWYQELFDGALDGYLVTDSSGYIQEANRAAAALLAVPHDFLVGKPVLLFVPLEERSAFWTHLAALTTVQRRHNWTSRLQPRGSPPCAAELTVTAMPGRMDQRGEFLWRLRDSTARMQAEVALRDSEARFRTMADAAPVLLWMAGPDMGCTYFNHGWLAFTGRTMEQERGDGWAEGVHPDDYARCVATYQTAFTARRPFEMEYRLRRADGLYRWVFDRGVPLVQPEEGFVGYIGSAIDLTELRHAQEELERRVQERITELARANAEIKCFTDMVSHDLRAPLITLKGFAKALRTSWDELQVTLHALIPHLEAPEQADVSRTLGQDIPEALGFIETCVTRMDHLIGAMLDVARLGRRTLHYEPLDMQALVQGTLRTLAHQMAQHQAQVTVGPLPEVVADRIAMEQILGNLLTNAVTYLEPGRPGEIVVTGERRPEVTVFTVRDNGRGIAKAALPTVFERFHRIGHQDVAGEGMGLAYVQMLVRRHGGDITCQSTLGEGTTFTFIIAQARPERSQIPDT
jgi:PAS domain S-box-containing protein